MYHVLNPLINMAADSSFSDEACRVVEATLLETEGQELSVYQLFVSAASLPGFPEYGASRRS